MATWLLAGGGFWGDSANWDGGVPDGVGVLAEFNLNGFSGAAEVSLADAGDIVLGTLNVNLTGNQGLTILGPSSGTGDLVFIGGGGTAQVNINSTLGSATGIFLLADFHLAVTLESNTVFNVMNPDSRAIIDANVGGVGTLVKTGGGLLELNGSNTFTGGIAITAGTLHAQNDAALGSGQVTISNDALFRSSGVIDNTIVTLVGASGPGGSAQIAVAGGQTLVLTGLLSHLSQGTISFGSSDLNGTIVASFAGINETASELPYRIAGGTLRMDNALSAAGLLSFPGTGLTEILSGAILDTGGFATTISSLHLNGGTIRSTIGALDLTVNHVSNAAIVQFGTIEGSGEVDHVTINASLNYELGAFNFVGWDSGTDTITLNGSAISNALSGSNANDTINGLGGADLIEGGDGDDLIDGGEGADTMHGGAGDDVYVIDSLGDQAIENPGQGTDTLIVPFTLTLGADFENLTLSGSANLNGTGNSGANVLTGNSGNNVLTGEGGNDVLDGGAGDDIMEGGLGDDVYVIDSAGDQAIELAGQGNDTLIVPYTLTLGADFENLTLSGSANLNGTGNSVANLLTGNSGNNVLTGEGGNDVLDGGAGLDQFHGGTGNDTFHVDQQGELVFENSGEGTDTVISSSQYYLFANIENLTLTGAADIFGVGNELANVLTGNAGQNLLIGWDGNDLIHGGVARDALFGVEGNDTIHGEGGIDYIVGGNGQDTIDGGDDPDEIYGEGGGDVIYGGVGFHTDILVGGNGDDYLHGDSGLGEYDLLYGNAGHDSFFVDSPADLVFEQLNEGIDTVYANINGAGYYLYANVEALHLLGNTPFGVGNELSNFLYGSDSDNWLLGGEGWDLIEGGRGNDVLFGEGGRDRFVINPGDGQDVIGDFDHNIESDRIDLRDFDFTFAQLQTRFVQNGNDGAILLDNGQMIVLKNVTMSQLTTLNFILMTTEAEAPSKTLSEPALAFDSLVGGEGFGGWDAGHLAGQALV
jgi:autotransporter-associated beta strand protein